MKIYCYWTSFRISFICCLFWGILGFKSNQRFCTLDFCISFTTTSAVCLISLFASFKYLFGLLFSYYRTAEKRTKWPLFKHSWNTIVLKIISLFLSSFWLTTLIFLLQRCIISSCSEEIIWFLAFKLVFTGAFRGYFPLLSQKLAVVVQEWKFCCIWFKVNNNSFPNIQFSRLLSGILSRCKEIMQFLVFLSGLNIKLSSFCW